ISLPTVSAQQAQAPANGPVAAPGPQKLTKEQKRKQGRALKELDRQYKEWLNEDVIYIISPDERTAFLQLDTNEEREQFIEQFWRISPDDGSFGTGCVDACAGRGLELDGIDGNGVECGPVHAFGRNELAEVDGGRAGEHE